MNKIKEIGNGIHPSIQLEIDYPSKHQDNKMPILDVKIWIEKRKKKGRNEEEGYETKIIHEYYQKEVSSKRVIHARTAMSKKQKRTILTQEMLRIMLRCSPLLPWTNTTKHINTFMMRMQYSGHTQKFREEIATSAMQAYNRIKHKDKTGEKPMYRNKDWQRKERRKEKRSKKTQWYKKGGHDTVIFVPCTPKSELKETYERIIQRTDIKMKVIEKRGQTLKDKLVRTNKTKEKECKDKENCLVCMKGGNGKCRQENVTYKIECEECKDVYIGETSRNAYTRGREHLSQMQRKDKNSILHRHQEQKHKDKETPSFRMTVTGSYRSALDRQITEAVQINRQPTDKLINNKCEFRQNKLMRTQLVFE